jgi:uncharacterized protein (DUF2236 family)
MARPLPFPSPVQRRIEAFAETLLQPPGAPVVDFTTPRGEAALTGPDSISWRIFKNPVSLFIGGVSAVILEFAEPAVRAGVWDHSSFRSDPVTRLSRTGLAAMMTVYGARSAAESMIAGVVRRHARVVGTDDAGKPYHANDVALLDWVQATASYGFGEAYSRYVHPLSRREFDTLLDEAAPAARLYGAIGAPRSVDEMEALFARMEPRLNASPVVFEFLSIMRGAAVFPAPLRPMQRLLVRAAVELTPLWLRDRLGLGARHGLRAWEHRLVRQLGGMADRVLLRGSPAVQSCTRLGLPTDYLYREEQSAAA